MAVVKESFREQLEKAVAGRHSHRHPFSEAWANGSLTREQLGMWVKQHYHYVGHFAEWLGAIYSRCPYEDARDFLLQNMWEEELGGTRHTDLLLRFGEACGVTKEEVENAEFYPGTLALVSWAELQAKDRHFVEAVAGLVVGLESQVPGIYRKQLPVLLDKYGFTEEEVEFFDLHITSDEVHGERGYQIVTRYGTTPELQEAALRKVHEATQMRWLYMTSLYENVVLGGQR